MDNLNLTEHNEEDMYKTFTKEGKKYIELQICMLKLQLVEKLSQILSYIAVVIVGCMLLMAAFVFFSMIFVVWMKSLTGTMITGFLIMGILFVCLFILLFLLRKKLLINPIIRKMSAILFSEEKEKNNDE